MKKILLACDDKALALLYTEELTEEGYDIVTTGNMSCLLEKIDEEKPDLIVVDCPINRYRNFDLTHAVRNGLCDIPVIVCTDYPSDFRDLLPRDKVVLRSSNFIPLMKAVTTAWGADCSFTEHLVSIPGTEIPPDQLSLPFAKQETPMSQN